jgi:hypothetical protein
MQRALGLSFALALASCGGHVVDLGGFEGGTGGNSGGLGEGSCALNGTSEVPMTILVPHCAIAGCHSAKNAMANLDLESPDLLRRLTGQMAQGGPGVIIDPGGDPNKSILYLKLKPDPPFLAQMPFAAPKLDDGSIACIGSWISDNVRAHD